MKLTFEVPIRIQSVANLREHWAVRAKRVKRERGAVMLAWRAATARTDCPGYWLISAVAGPPPGGCTITLTRVAPRPIKDTHDNLRSAFKAVADEVAKQLGIDDGDPRITWRYEQAKGDYAVRVCIESAEREAA